ncbi:MAG: uroporphyrinogen-III synthase [Roseivivax sp.]|nr:uroporphyrinogen-III synthase [Roseivivax sp.]
MTDLRPVLLLTRPEDSARTFWDSLPEALRTGCDCVIAPLIGFRPLPAATDLTAYDGLVLTSAQALAALPSPPPPGMTAYCVGASTARAARRAGLAAVSAEGDAAALVALVAQQAPGARLLHLRGTHARGDVAATLTAAGVPTDEAVVYDQPAIPLTDQARAALDGTAPVVVPLFSPRTAALFAAGHAGKADLYLACMSAAVARETQSLRAKDRAVAPHPDAASMRDTVETLAFEAGCLRHGQHGL